MNKNVNVQKETAKAMARALRLLLVPYSRVSTATLQSAYRDQRTPAGLGKHSPGEILYARMALADYERMSQ